MMEKVIEILMDIDDSVDYETEERLIDDRILDSFGLISLVAEFENEFGVLIEATDMIPANFNSARAMWAMIQRLMERC